MLHEATHDQQSDRPIVEVRDLTCGYEGSIVLRNVNFRVMREDFIALLGPSGCGKTTLIESFIESLPKDVVLAHISQTQLSPVEFLQSRSASGRSACGR